MAQAAVAAIVAGLIVVAPRLRGTSWASWFTRLAWSWAGVPSGPLGWISSNWTMPVLHGPIYPVMARELDLQPDDDLLEVACGSGIFLATPAALNREAPSGERPVQGRGGDDGATRVDPGPRLPEPDARAHTDD
jgi:hypothetical protein